jgi:hypothetical protein
MIFINIHVTAFFPSVIPTFSWQASLKVCKESQEKLFHHIQLTNIGQ